MTSYLNITMIVSIIFAVLAITAASSPSCTPSYLLHQVIHGNLHLNIDSVTLSSFNTSASLTQTSYSYPYFQNLFTGQPTVIICNILLIQPLANYFPPRFLNSIISCLAKFKTNH